ncbi:hypothetical protein Rm378p044 [Rhodothermus phage RM378]|uniref:hypothetical protein n=1 Tax=Rhodothermus phage RM378 TaxID=148943 RepID=UPI000018F635|nr:hypothetical protein Rm378p044 [Rhodothermus phage RM378]
MKWFKRLTTLEISLLIPLFISLSVYFSTQGVAKFVALPVWVVALVIAAIDVAKFVSVGLLVTTRGWLLKTILIPVILCAVFATSFSFYAALVYSHAESVSSEKVENITEATITRETVQRQIARYEQLLEEVDRSIENMNNTTTESIWQERLRKRELESLVNRKEEYLAAIDSLEAVLVSSTVESNQRQNLFFLNYITPNFYFVLLTIIFDPLAVLLYALFVRMLKQNAREEDEKEVKEEKTGVEVVKPNEPEEQDFVSKQEEAEQLLMDKVFQTKRFAFDPTRMQPQKVVIREKRRR